MPKGIFHVALLCAMPEEIGSTIQNLNNLSESKFGDLKIYSGEWLKPGSKSPSVIISVAWSGWGKVSAARAATRLLAFKYYDSKVDLLLFTGVAGSANSEINQWDIIIPSELIQHDIDARPIFEKFVIPSLNKAKISSIKTWVDWAQSSLKLTINKKRLYKFGDVQTGLIATGDKFISNKAVLFDLSQQIPGLSAIEMEGAAVAQVAYQEEVPWLVVRVISDNADEKAAQNFNEFLEDYSKYSWNLIESLMINFLNSPFYKD